MSLCTFRKFRISSALDEGREIPAALQTHIESCRSCREFVQSSRQLDQRIVSTASPDDAEIPGWLSTSVMAKINSPDEKQSQPKRWIPALAGAGAIALVVGAIALKVGAPADDPIPEVATVEISAPIPQVTPAAMPEKLEQHAKKKLSNEFQKLASDINGARGFLSASFRRTIPGLGD